jgi:choline dehydrogenase-like flavoprotein
MGVVVKPPKELSKSLHSVSLQYLTEEDITNAKSNGVAVETPPAHLGIFGLLLPWNNGLDMKLQAMSHENTGVFIGISRDHGIETNRVIIDNDGNPVIYYQLSKQDEKMLLIGLERQIRMLFSTGCKYLMIGHSNFPLFYCKQENVEKKLDAFIHTIWKEGIQANRMSLFTAHQMSSCRMSSSVKDGPTSITGELYECENCFIADGSVLPTSLGINPMITIEAYSYMISKHVIKKLQTLNKY